MFQSNRVGKIQHTTNRAISFYTLHKASKSPEISNHRIIPRQGVTALGCRVEHPEVSPYSTQRGSTMSEETKSRMAGGTFHISLLHGDCVLRMQSLEEGSVDVIVCDPPYG